MASSSCPVVLGEQYCYDHEVKLEMKEEWWVACGGFVIKDIHGKEYFQVHLFLVMAVIYHNHAVFPQGNLTVSKSMLKSHRTTME